LRWNQYGLSLNPHIPKHWKEFSFKLIYKGALLTITVSSSTVNILLESGFVPSISVCNQTYSLQAGVELSIPIDK
nr:glycosyl hydrolase family 65 protein [Bacteroidales bacterium]